MFTGNGIGGIDGKGRVGIPAALRHALEKNGDGRFLHIALHESDPCLVGYDSGWSQHLRGQLRDDEAAARAAGQCFDRANRNRLAFGATVELGYDASGRFILPGDMRAIAGLEANAFFLGTGDVFEIWNPQTLIATPGIDDRLKQLVAAQIRQREGA